MQIKTKLSSTDLTNVNFVLLLRRSSTKIYILFFVIPLAVIVGQPLSNGKYLSITSILSPFLILVVFISLSTFIGSKITYRANPRIRETVEYIFDKDYLEITGESFSSKLTWEKIYKVTKTKHWLLIWQTRQIANVIPLRDVWEGDVTTLKEILSSHRVKNNL